MRKIIPVFMLVLASLLSLSACGNKNNQNAGSGGSPLSSLLSINKPFEGVLTMQTSIPGAANAETKMFISKEGMRYESTTTVKQLANPIKMVMISPAGTPNLIYLINDETKSYTIIDTDQIKKDLETAGRKDFYEDAKIENLGKENVNGYDCTHIRITSDKNVMEMWVSRDIIDYATYAKMQGARDKNMSSLARKLKDAGLDGFPVRTSISMSAPSAAEGKEPAAVVTDLVKVEKQGLDASLFKVPDGYVKAEIPSMMNFGSSPKNRAQMDAMMKKMQEQMKNQGQ
ncbi:MAG: DUF4412 domain-containing protein [Chlorobiaceae bacterium]|nr:DUF4412 domain-containing protein [Chlorobiaceae bacterium]NTW11605.1 DUF4412 domain-containing protein [Chlorobiaceae bacterium]